MKRLIEKILQNQSGHWGLIEPMYGMSHLDELLESLQKRPNTRVTRLSCSVRTVPFSEGAAGDLVQRTCEAFEEMYREAANEGADCLCCVLEDFQEIDVGSQCRLLSFTRKIREQSRDLQVQTVIYGKWNRYRLQSHWQQHPNVSPVPDQRNVYCFDCASGDELSRLLEKERLIPSHPSELECLAVEALLEFTGGDLLLIEEVLGILKANRSPLADFQETLEDVVASGRVVDDLNSRLRSLPAGATELVRGILASHALVVDSREPIIEDLRLLGMLRLKKMRNRAVAIMPSPLMDTALRRNWHRLNLGGTGVCNSSDLVWPLASINGHAYGLVLEIETLLRNWLVSALGDEVCRDWREDLREVKTLAGDASVITEDIRVLGSKLLEVLYPSVDFSGLGSDQASPTGEFQADPEGFAKKKVDNAKGMVGVIDSAEDWRKRVVSNVFVRISGTGLPGFFTTGALANVLMYSKGRVSEVVKTVFSQREDIRRFLTKFGAIRSAVAHNQVLAFSAVEDLVSLLCELTSRLGMQEMP